MTQQNKEQAGSRVPDGMAMAESGNDNQNNDVKRESPLPSMTAQLPRYASTALFASSSEILIDHNGAVYTLRKTRSGGLILNK
jgi:hemin uptake protein HemP